MTNLEIAARRLHNQRLSGGKLATASEVVKWLGAVQSQEYAGAKWSLGMRMQAATDAELDRAFNAGEILRTHVMRPTWHFVTPDDIRWLLELTAPRVHAVNAYMYRQLDLEDTLYHRSISIILKALEGHQYRTREELGATLAEAGIEAQGRRLGYIVHRAELDALVCSGPRKGKQFTYALLDERAPHARRLPREEALAELTRRYFTSHGPAMIHDFAAWSGLTIADVKAGLAMLKGEIVAEEIDGKQYWSAASGEAIHREPSPTAHLLPAYDEYAIVLRDHSAILDPAHGEMMKDAPYFGNIIIDGILVGNWRRTLQRKQVVIECRPFRPYTAAEQEAFMAAAQRFGDFLGLPVALAG